MGRDKIHSLPTMLLSDANLAQSLAAPWLRAHVLRRFALPMIFSYGVHGALLLGREIVDGGSNHAFESQIFEVFDKILVDKRGERLGDGIAGGTRGRYGGLIAREDAFPGIAKPGDESIVGFFFRVRIINVLECTNSNQLEGSLNSSQGLS